MPFKMDSENTTKLILLVEDDNDHAFLFDYALKSLKINYKLDHVTDGEEALHYLYRSGKYTGFLQKPYPDVIILDLKLPKINGFELLDIILENEKIRDIPVVVVSSSTYDKDWDTITTKNIKGFLIKPIYADILDKLLTEIGFCHVI